MVAGHVLPSSRSLIQHNAFSSAKKLSAWQWLFALLHQIVWFSTRCEPDNQKLTFQVKKNAIHTILYLGNFYSFDVKFVFTSNF
jgi:hypothetical protein